MAWSAKINAISVNLQGVDVTLEIFNGTTSKGTQDVTLPFDFTIEQGVAIVRERIARAHKADDLNTTLQQYVGATVTE